MAADPESLDVELAAAVFREMGDMLEEESRLREAVQQMVRKVFPNVCLFVGFSVIFRLEVFQLYMFSTPCSILPCHDPSLSAGGAVL